MLHNEQNSFMKRTVSVFRYTSVMRLVCGILPVGTILFRADSHLRKVNRKALTEHETYEDAEEETDYAYDRYAAMR